mgnify:CR=1 FL=1
MSGHRLLAGGRIDRARRLGFTFDGTRLYGFRSGGAPSRLTFETRVGIRALDYISQRDSVWMFRAAYFQGLLQSVEKDFTPWGIMAGKFQGAIPANTPSGSMYCTVS